MLKVDFWMMILLSIMLLFDSNNIFCLSLAAVALHEAGHFVAIVLTKQKISKFGLELGTVTIDVNGEDIDLKTRIIIASAGCVFNAVALIVSVCLHGEVFALINAAICIFNLLPVYGLDGYDIIGSLLSEKVLKTVSLLCNFLVFFFGIFLLFYKNPTVLIASVFLFLKQKHRIK